MATRLPLRSPAALAAGVSILGWAVACGSPPAEPPPPSLAIEQAPGAFRLATDPLTFNEAVDHGPHLEFQTEWWYYTGHLQAGLGQEFGYQLTFFRRGLSPGEPRRESNLATNQIYFAHLALTDVGLSEHRAFERFSRGVPGLAGAEADPFRVYLEDWSAGDLEATDGAIRLQAREQDLAIDLQLRADRPLVPHGPGGLSPKGGDLFNANYYFSYPLMATEGSLEVGGRRFEVRGSSWFDHEWGSSALPAEAQGWDWFGLQLDDGRQLMLFRVRMGGPEGFQAGTLVAADGQVTWLQPQDFAVEVLGTWTSPQSGAVYPSGWRLSLPQHGLRLELEPLLADQENRLAIVYWEGAVRVEGTVGGRGYVELTGYLAGFGPRF